MQIAITSQNRKTITEHAGKCRKFWLYDIEQEQVTNKRLIELPIEQSFHGSHHGLPEALSSINVLISGGMGGKLFRRLLDLGVQPLVACEENPDQAIADFLAGCLLTRSLANACLDHAHDHEHHEHSH